MSSMGAGAHRLDDPGASRLGQPHVGDDRTSVEDENTIGNFERLIDIRCGDKYRGQSGHLTDRLSDVMPSVDVNATERLIE